MKQYNFKNFTTNKEALERWKEIEAVMPEILNLPLEQWNSLKVVHDEPEVWRLWMPCGEVRINLHLIAPCSDPFLHFHPWPAIAKCIRGGYLHKTSSYPFDKEHMIREIMENQNEEGYIEEMAIRSLEFIPPLVTNIVPGSFYVNTDIRLCHQVIVPERSEWSSSVFVTGLPYQKGLSTLLSRKQTKSNPELNEKEKVIVSNFVRTSYGLSEW